MATAPRRSLAFLASAALALAGVAGCGEEEESNTVTAPDTAAEGTTGATGSKGKPDERKPASESSDEGAGSGLEEDIGGADSDGTDTDAGQQATTGDTTAE
jgi:hypothetical protein